MRSDRQPSRENPAPRPSRAFDSGLDHGFGQMLHQAGITPDLIEELALGDGKPGGSLFEQTLLERWPVDDYESVVADPQAVLSATDSDRKRFMETAGEVVHELERVDIADLIEIRLPVGGVQLDWRRFELCDLHLGQLWLAEARMLDWLAASRDHIETICRPARAWALAASACEIERMTGQTRAAACESGDLPAYLNQLFGRAFNLHGFNALDPCQLSAKGQNPLLLASGAARLQAEDKATSARVFRALGFSVRQATAAQLRTVAQLLFDLGRLESEQFSLLSHGEWLLPGSEMALPQDWIDRYGAMLSELWIRGDRGSWVESTLQLLKRAESGAAG